MPLQCTCSHCGTPVDVKPSNVRPDGVYYHSICYQAARRIRSARTLSARTWAKVDKNGPTPDYAPHLGPCWIWTGSRNQHGYGKTSLNGKLLPAHRFTWEDTNGPIPDGLVIDHLCRVPPCVNPSHLEPVSTKENLRRGMSPSAVMGRTNICRRGHCLTDATISIEGGFRRCKECRAESARRRRIVNPPVRRGRAVGERSGNARLTDSTVREIRAIAATGTATNRALARRYGVSPTMIGHIVKRKAWKHID